MHNESLNVHNTEYPCYPLCYSPPPPNLNYVSAGSNSTPSATHTPTPTGSMVGVGHFEENIELSSDERHVEEVVAVILGGRKSGQ